MRKLLYFLPLLLWSCGGEVANKNQTSTYKPPVKTTMLSYEIVAEHLHDSTAFTEGLLFHNGVLFESTGSPQELPDAKSYVGIVDSITGRLDAKIEIDRNTFFGEGMVILNDKIYQLTYRKKVGFVYDLKTYKEIGRFPIQSEEGWGMTTDGEHLIMSDGTSTIRFLNPNDFSQVKSFDVLENGGAMPYINELEFVDGYIYANVFTTNRILKIDAKNGNVVAKMDLGELAMKAKQQYNGSMEMNGIAYHSKKQTFYVTGKMWNRMYEIRVF